MRLSPVPVVPRPEPAMRTLHGLFTPEQIRWVLRRERARADRHAREFSVVLFRAEHHEWPQTPSLRLAKIMLGVARNTDEVGRFDDHWTCAVLPETDATGARVFAEKVCDAADARGLHPRCEIYTYPNAWMDGDVRPAVRLAQDVAGPDQPATGAAADAAPAGGRVRDLLPYVIKGAAAALGDGTGGTPGLRDIDVIHQLESLMVRPMPRWKRALDLLGAAFAILIFGPLMLVSAALIKLTSPGPVVFKQCRAGLGGRPFTIFKFRTMIPDAEAKKKDLRALSEQDGPAFKLTNDPRVTSIGKFLRKTSLDELPQLFNVLRGDMSLVGPRPLPCDESDNCDQWHRQRLEVTPGLTCIWQITGRSTVSFDEWVRMDINYIRRRKLSQDLSLLARTVPAVLLRKGAR